MRIESVLDLHSQFPDPDGHWSNGDMAKTETALRAAIPADFAGPWTETSLRAGTQLVRVLNLQGNSSGAKEILTAIRKIELSLSAESLNRHHIRLLIEEGRHLCMAMMPGKAQSPFQQALTMAKAANEVALAIEASVMLSISRPPKHKDDWLYSAIEMAENTDVPEAKLWLAQLYLMDGWLAFDFRRFEDALQRFTLALDRPRSPGEMTDLILIRWCVARTLRALGRNQEALDIQKDLLAEVTRSGKPNGYVFLEIAECLQLLGAKDAAKTHFESAYRELSANGWYSDNRAFELSRMHYLYKKR